MSDSESFKFKSKFTNNTNAAGTSNDEIAVPLKCSSNYWITFEMPLINYEINLMLTWLTINWNKYQSKVTSQVQNNYLDYLSDPNYQ